MTTMLIIIFLLILLIILILFLEWRVLLCGHILVDSHHHNYYGSLIFGGRNQGIGVVFQNGTRCLFLGSAKGRGFRWNLPSKKKTPRKGLPSIPVPQIIHVARKLIRWETFRLNGEVGFGNPMATGFLYGSLAAIQNLIQYRRCKIELMPCFTRKLTDLTCDAVFHVRPAIFLWRATSIYWKRKH